MELFVNGKKCSMFGDEEIELTKNWNDQQILTGYGSWSKTFSLPIDANNSEIFSYYNRIGGSFYNNNISGYTNTFDPNYFLPATIYINEFKVDGNIAVGGFSIKDQMPYSFQVNFFGDEKNLIKDLNASEVYSKMSNLNMSGLTFQFNIDNVLDTWYFTNLPVYVPLMATNRPLNFRDTPNPNNINSDFNSGVTMADLKTSYHLKHLLDRLFQGNNITLQHSAEVTNFLYELYLMPNTKVEYSSDEITFIYCKADSTQTGRFHLTPGPDTTTGILAGNTDFTSYNNINNYLISNNLYTNADPGEYNFTINYDCSNVSNISGEFAYIAISVYGQKGVKFRFSGQLTNTNKKGIISTTLNFDEAGYETQIVATFFTINHQEFYFDPGILTASIKYQKIENTIYDYKQSRINFPDTLVSDFFVNFCKSFNIFFIYNGDTRIVNTYFKNELPVSTYELSRYNILDETYAFTHQQKYKTVDYMFAEPKDINNLAWKQGANTSFKTSDRLWYGENKSIYPYDVAQDKLEFKSIFTVFPKTTLNRTDNNNIILEDTEIPLHSELNESLTPLNTDFLLFYKLFPIDIDIVTGFTYNLQSGFTFGYRKMNFASNYGPDGTNGYSLDYKLFPNVIKDNINKVYETTLYFLLPSDILYKLKVYDTIVVNGIWYEIQSFSLNIRTGYTKIKVQTTAINNPNPIIIIPPLTGETIAHEPCCILMGGSIELYTGTTTTTTTTAATTTTTTSTTEATTTTTTEAPTTTTTTTTINLLIDPDILYFSAEGGEFHVDITSDLIDLVAITGTTQPEVINTYFTPTNSGNTTWVIIVAPNTGVTDNIGWLDFYHNTSTYILSFQIRQSESGSTGYTYSGSSVDYANSGDSCFLQPGNLDTIFYSPSEVLFTGMVLYTNSNMSVKLVGDPSRWRALSDGVITHSVQINDTGAVKIGGFYC